MVKDKTNAITSTTEFRRIIWLHNQLKIGGVTKHDYLSKFEVSERTFLRDLNKLRDYFVAPVFCYEDSVYKYKDTNFDLPAILLSESELFGLLISSVLLKHYKDTPMYSSLQKILKHLSENLSTNISYIYLDAYEGNDSFRSFKWEHIEMLIKAIYQKSSIEMTYTSFNSHTATVRQISPVHIYNYQGEFYVVGYCHKHQAFRDFFVGRIQELKVIPNTLAIPEFNVKEYFSHNQWGLLKGGTVEKVEFKVKSQFEPWLKEKFGSKLEKIKDENDWVFYVTEVAINNDFLNWALDFNKSIVILKPDHVKDKIIKHCHEILKNHSM